MVHTTPVTVIANDLSAGQLTVEARKSGHKPDTESLGPSNAHGFRLQKDNGDSLLLTYNKENKFAVLQKGTQLILASTYFPHATKAHAITVVANDLSAGELTVEARKSGNQPDAERLGSGAAYGFKLQKDDGNSLILTYNNENKLGGLKKGTQLILTSKYFPQAIKVHAISVTVVANDLSAGKLTIEARKSGKKPDIARLEPGDARSFKLRRDDGDSLLLTYNKGNKLADLKKGTQLVLASTYFPPQSA